MGELRRIVRAHPPLRMSQNYTTSRCALPLSNARSAVPVYLIIGGEGGGEPKLGERPGGLGGGERESTTSARVKRSAPPAGAIGTAESGFPLAC